jgi:hypothetical protein
MPFHLTTFIDQKGIHRLQIIRGNAAHTLKSFASMKAAYRWLGELKEQFQLQGRWIGLHAYQGETIDLEIEEHNRKLELALESMLEKAPSYVIIGKGTQPSEKSLVWVHKGQLVGVGMVPSAWRFNKELDLETVVEPIPSSEITEYILKSHLENPKGSYIKYF